ncbi:hypothetical protein PO909_004399 [Leuciscus waleckii]
MAATPELKFPLRIFLGVGLYVPGSNECGTWFAMDLQDYRTSLGEEKTDSKCDGIHNSGQCYSWHSKFSDLSDSELSATAKETDYKLPVMNSVPPVKATEAVSELSELSVMAIEAINKLLVLCLSVLLCSPILPAPPWFHAPPAPPWGSALAALRACPNPLLLF